MEWKSEMVAIMTEAQLERAVERAVERKLAEMSGARKRDAGPGGGSVPRVVAAARLGVSVSALDHWTRHGKVLCERREGRIFYSERELARLRETLGLR